MKCLLIHRDQHNTEYYSIIDEVSILNDIRINKLPMKLPLCHIREGELFELCIEKHPSKIICDVKECTIEEHKKLIEMIHKSDFGVNIGGFKTDYKKIKNAINKVIQMKRKNQIRDYIE